MQIGRHELPLVCCVCLGPADPEQAMKMPVLPAVEVPIPLCAACRSKTQRRKWKIGLAVTAGLFAALSVLLFALQLEREEFWILFLASIPFVAAVGGVVGHLRTVPVRIRVKDGSRGILHLRFKNREFERYLPWVR
jgi:hypothetical protein